MASICITNQSGISEVFTIGMNFLKLMKGSIQLIGEPNPIYSIYANSHINSNLNNWRKPNPYML